MAEKREKGGFFSPYRQARADKIYLSQRRIYLLPRKKGIVFFCFILLLLLLATNFQNPLIHLLLFWLMGLAFVSLFSTWRNLYGLTISIENPDNIFVGEEVQWVLQIEENALFVAAKGASRANNLPGRFLGKKRIKGRPRSLRAKFYESRKKKSSPSAVSSSLLPALNRGGGRWVVLLNSKGIRRGYNKVPLIQLESHAPFGFFKAWTYLRLEGAVLAYPQPIPSEIPRQKSQSPDDLEAILEKEAMDTSLEGSEDFDELIPYEKSHSLRRIHWRAYAKGQGLFTMRFKDYAGESSWYDREDYLDGEELARAKLCYHLLEAEERGELYGLKLAGKRYPPSQGREHLTRLLTALALDE